MEDCASAAYDCGVELVHAVLQAFWRHRVRSFTSPEAPAAAPGMTDSQLLAPQESDLNERWTAALSAVKPAPAAAAAAAAPPDAPEADAS